MIKLFETENYHIDTGIFTNLLHDKIVTQFEEEFAKYVGADYACSFNSASSAIFLLFKYVTPHIVHIPSILPPVVANAIINAGCSIKFLDNVDWVGNSYILDIFPDHWKFIDSAQRVDKDQFKLEAKDNDLMVFSFYPTKPIGSCDGGMLVSNDRQKIEFFRETSFNGMSPAINNWERHIKFSGWKMYMNSIQAYIALQNLRTLEERKERLYRIRKVYNQRLGLNNTSDHLYRVSVKDNTTATKIILNMTTGIHYKALHLNSLYNTEEISLPKSEKVSRETLSIPFHSKLTSLEIDDVCNTIEKFL